MTPEIEWMQTVWTRFVGRDAVFDGDNLRWFRDVAGVGNRLMCSCRRACSLREKAVIQNQCVLGTIGGALHFFISLLIQGLYQISRHSGRNELFL